MTLVYVLVQAAVLLALLAEPALAQSVHPRSGRRIAPVMGFAGADWLERDERMLEEDPEKAIRLLKLKPGMVVADVGAGTGYYTFRMARLVGSAGKVYANDIQPEMLARMRRKVEREKISNVELVSGTETDPHLPAQALDYIVLVDVYHEFSHPQEMLRRLRDCLKPDGRLVLLEFRKEDPYVPIRPEHKMSVAEARLEVEQEGFQMEKVLSDLPWQHMMFFRKSAK
jgi:SAM-dependent methyltransferase